VSGGNIGFRITDMRGDKPVGAWVIRTSASGPWVEPALPR
jgi:hypothetical protein